MEKEYTLVYQEFDTRTNKVIKNIKFRDTLDGLMRNSEYKSMHTFQCLGQVASKWYKSRGFKNPHRDWNKWVAIVDNNIINFIDILNEIEEETRDLYINVGSTGACIHTKCKYYLEN